MKTKLSRLSTTELETRLVIAEREMSDRLRIWKAAGLPTDCGSIWASSNRGDPFAKAITATAARQTELIEEIHARNSATF